MKKTARTRNVIIPVSMPTMRSVDETQLQSSMGTMLLKVHTMK